VTKFRVGLLIGLAAGYYLGAKAGRRRYAQINRVTSSLRHHQRVEQAATAVSRARALVDLSRERVHEVVDPEAGWATTARQAEYVAR